MSEEEELKEIRRRKMEMMQQQAANQQIANSQQTEFENKKYSLMRKILSQEGRQRLENIRMVKPEFAEQIELQLIQLYQAGSLRGAIPLPDKAFKNLLTQITGTKKDYKIKNI